MGTTEGRRLPWQKVGIAAIAVVACLGAGGWALAGGDDDPGGTRTSAETTAEPTTTTSAPTTTVPPTTTTTEVVLPAPERAPQDEYAPTPEVVHGTLALPTIGVEQPLHEGVTLTAINRGPSHWPGTAMPGQVGNVVVAGHRTTHTQPFLDLDQLQPGDPLVFTLNDGSRVSYELTGTEIVDPSAMHVVDQTPERTATLFACHPKGSAAQRIIARFRLVEP